MSSPKLRFNEFKEHIQAIPLNEVAEIYDGTHATPKYVQQGIPFYSVEQVTANDFSKTKFIAEDVFEKECKRVVLERGDVLMTRIGDVGTSRLIDWDVRASFYVSLALIKPQTNVLGAYIAQYIHSPFFQRELFKRMIHVAFPKKINLGEIGKCHISVPQDSEQQKIADFLSSVDKKISLLKEKHALLTQYKKGVMQKLFKQEIRFKDDNGNDFPSWQDEKLGKWLEEYKAKSTEENQFEVLTSSRTGLMKQSDYYGEGRITERSNQGFNIIPNGFLTFRSRSDDRQFFFNLNELGYTGIISTYYPVFKMKNDQNRFFVELSRFHKNRFGRQAVGTSQVVLSFNELKNIKFAMPCTEEQAKIAEFAGALDKKLDAVNQQIELTQTFKKGLLQQMFV